MVTRHEFLARLHDLLKPKVYLEVGVQYGLSLNLAVHSEQAWGIDPNPLVQATGNQIIVPYESRLALSGFFSGPRPEHVDLAFIDGSHLFEDALRDFNNIARYCTNRSVIVFDDVLPYNQEVAARTMPPAGDWTGDAWKVVPIIRGRLGLTGTEMMLVDTFPTGTFVVWNLPIHDRAGKRAHDLRLARLELDYEDLVTEWLPMDTVPDNILQRVQAHQPQDVLDRIKEDLCPESQ